MCLTNYHHARKNATIAFKINLLRGAVHFKFETTEFLLKLALNTIDITNIQTCNKSYKSDVELMRAWKGKRYWRHRIKSLLRVCWSVAKHFLWRLLPHIQKVAIVAALEEVRQDKSEESICW